jgi:S1-C subfamily serine protease
MALIPSHYLHCVVALGIDTPKGRRWVASGFFYGSFVEKVNEGKNRYSVYLVTNRHVFKDTTKLYIRCNPEGQEKAKEYGLSLVDNEGKPKWSGHPNPEIDVAAISVNIRKLEEEKMQVNFFTSDHDVANRDKLVELGITEGDFAYALGFPMELIGGERNYVLVRSGTIARIRDALSKVSNEFLLDAFIFPGNSGGPVISKPEALAIKGTKSQNAAYLIGIIKSYVPYQDVAVSLQTNEPRVIFAENSGLAGVLPMDFVQEAVQEQIKYKEQLKGDKSHRTEQATS